MTTDWLNENHIAAVSEATGIPKGLIRAAVRAYFDVAYPDSDGKLVKAPKPGQTILGPLEELPDLPDLPE